MLVVLFPNFSKFPNFTKLFINAPLCLFRLSRLSRLLLSLDIGAEGAQGGALPQAPPLSKAGVWGGM